RSTNISMPSAISWNAASASSSSSVASQPASKKPPEITEPSLSLPSSYGCDKCPHCLARPRTPKTGANPVGGERLETWVTLRTGHMGNTFRLLWAGGVDAVESEFGDGGAPAVCRPAVGRGDNDGRMPGFRHFAEDRLQDL